MVFEHLTEKEARMYVEQMMIDGLTAEEAFDYRSSGAGIRCD